MFPFYSYALLSVFIYNFRAKVNETHTISTRKSDRGYNKFRHMFLMIQGVPRSVLKIVTQPTRLETCHRAIWAASWRRGWDKNRSSKKRLAVQESLARDSLKRNITILHGYYSLPQSRLNYYSCSDWMVNHGFLFWDIVLLKHYHCQPQMWCGKPQPKGQAKQTTGLKHDKAENVEQICYTNHFLMSASPDSFLKFLLGIKNSLLCVLKSLKLSSISYWNARAGWCITVFETCRFSGLIQSI